MALVLDYEFDNFSTAADGTRKVVDASGNLNDGIMESGQGLEFDGVDDYVDTDIIISDGNIQTIFSDVVPYQNGVYHIIYGNLNTGATNYFFLSFYLDKFILYSNSITYGPAYVANTYYSTMVTLDYINNNMNMFIDGTYAATSNDAPPSGNTIPLYIGARNDNPRDLINFNGKIYNLIALDVIATEADSFYHKQNPNAIIEMAITGIDNPNFSFSPINIKHCFPLDEGIGTLTHDIVTAKSYNMVNFPTDNTQWTNADLQPYGHQKLRFKKDTNGNPSALADPKTIRFD